MKKVIITALLFVACATVGYARPTLGLGLKLIHNMMSQGTTYILPDTSTYVVWDQEYFWGIGGSFIVNFTEHIGLSMEAVEFNLNSDRPGEGNGGITLDLFSGLNADLVITLPVGRRISPLVYGGVTLKKFFGKPVDDPRNDAFPYNIRLGLGGQYTINDRVKVVADIQMYDKTQTEAEGYPYTSWEITETVGIVRFDVGVHYGL